MVVFVANPTADPIDAEVDLHVKLTSVRELWADRRVGAGGSVIRDALPPYTINIYESAL
jgi:beta-galactosidase